MSKYKLFFTVEGKVHIIDYYESPKSEKDLVGYVGFIEAICGGEVRKPEDIEIFLSEEGEIKKGEIYVNGDKKTRGNNLCSDCKTKYKDMES